MVILRASLELRLPRSLTPTAFTAWAAGHRTDYGRPTVSPFHTSPRFPKAQMPRE
jgi:hypothetical protein